MVRGGLFACEQRIGRHPYSLDDLNFHMTFRNLYRSSVQGKRSRELSSVQHTDCEINNVSGTTAVTRNQNTNMDFVKQHEKIYFLERIQLDELSKR